MALNVGGLHGEAFRELLSHRGHEIECAAYGEDVREPANIALECVTCGEVLLDFDNADLT